MDAVKTILAVIGGYTLSDVALSIWTYLRGDRSGNSGHYGHFDANRRIDGPDGA